MLARFGRNYARGALSAKQHRKIEKRGQAKQAGHFSTAAPISNRITVAAGDGIGPEITDSTLAILNAAGANLKYDFIEVGEKVYLSGETSGISASAWNTLRSNPVLLKGPITTPQGGGYKSLNVTIRKSLRLFANVRPTVALHPFIHTYYPKLDVVIIRENEEDLYAAIEHQQTPEVVQALKIITVPGCEAIARYAFEFARAYGRKKVTCMTKDNIMKHADGLFHKIFDEVAKEYPEIQSNHMIIDIGAARLAAKPESLDVICTLNLYGDILSDIVAEVAGSVGIGGSANVGDKFAMFEAIHGSAPDIAGQNIANPGGLINAASMMLVHMGHSQTATKIQNAWLKTIEDGIHTADIYNPKSTGARKVGTKEFTDAVIARLGQAPSSLKVAQFGSNKIGIKMSNRPRQKKEQIGVDIFLEWDQSSRNPNVLGEALKKLAESKNLKLKVITNRGVRVFPDGIPETFCTDHWRCRFVKPDFSPVSAPQMIDLMQEISKAGFDIIKTENLYNFDGKRAYSLAQGE